MSAVEVDTHVQAVIDDLNAAAMQDDWSPAPVEFGRGERPEGAGWQGAATQSPFQSYGIVWRIGSQDAVNHSLDDNRATEARLLVFIRVFGGFPAQADRVLDLMHARMMSRSLEVPGRRLVAGNGVRLENGQTSTKTEDVEYTLYEAGNFYRIRTVPE